ncbi:MAG: hypothetical protein EA409_05705 [Saprospirales bacterium]|nr:MAG: hypothetical protein EA409_05705 [Saprospirales bacterium]
MIFARIISLTCIMVSGLSLWGQGPPIRLDKPIMLGSGESTVRALYNYIDFESGNYSYLLVEADYNISSDLAVGVEMPWVISGTYGSHQPGDFALMGKYQFYRKDGLGKTTRIAAKVKQTFPSGKDLKVPTIGMGHYKTYIGGLAAYESLSLGIQTEVGYYLIPSDSHLNALSYKLGVSIPLLEPSFPVNQINVYLEAEGMNMGSHEGESQYGYYLAPGIQYARGRYTFEASLQFPVSQQMHGGYQRDWWLMAGARRLL